MNALRVLLLFITSMVMDVVPAFTKDMWAGGTPKPWCIRRFKVKTVTGLKLGVAVEKDTTDDEVKLAVAGSKVSHGIYSKNITQPDLAADSAPTAGDEIEVVIWGSGAVCKAMIAANLADGVKMNIDANGALVAAVEAALGDMHKAVGRKYGDTDGTTPTRGLVVA